MKLIKIIIIVFSFFVTFISGQDSTNANSKKVNIQKNLQYGKFFIDKNGDGYNDNAPDHDGDGIPNGIDPDYKQFVKKRKKGTLPYIDLDGDGINDNLQVKGKNNLIQKNIRPKNINPQNPENNNNGNGKNNRKGKGGRK